MFDCRVRWQAACAYARAICAEATHVPPRYGFCHAPGVALTGHGLSLVHTCVPSSVLLFCYRQAAVMVYLDVRLGPLANSCPPPQAGAANACTMRWCMHAKSLHAMIASRCNTRGQ